MLSYWIGKLKLIWEFFINSLFQELIFIKIISINKKDIIRLIYVLKVHDLIQVYQNDDNTCITCNISLFLYDVIYILEIFLNYIFKLMWTCIIYSYTIYYIIDKNKSCKIYKNNKENN